jgi:hypothetical protein
MSGGTTGKNNKKSLLSFQTSSSIIAPTTIDNDLINNSRTSMVKKSP